jgi:hypothetical protein
MAFGSINPEPAKRTQVNNNDVRVLFSDIIGMAT